MKCSLCDKETGIIQLIENLGACNRCIKRKPYHPTWEDYASFAVLGAFILYLMLVRFGYI
jgi:hypothetical protein